MHILGLSFKVQPKHVKEAFRLLNKSIIRVETPDVQFDDDDEEQQEGKIQKQNKYAVKGPYENVGPNINIT